MRRSLRLLASVATRSTYEAGHPTGLTGLYTHKSPRSTLLYLYSTTLDRLKEFPEGSVYRASTEALTKHRMNIIESVKPAGLTEWQQRVSQLCDKYPEAVRRIKTLEGTSQDDFNIIYYEPAPEQQWRSEDDRVNAEYKRRPQPEGPREFSEVSDRGRELARDTVKEEASRIHIEAEPALTMEQIGEVEQRIGAGLIEEIIKVAEGEKELAGTLREAQV